MKKTFTIISIILVFSLLGNFLYKNATNYSHVLKVNWNIELPKHSNMKEIYSTNSSASIHGDGIRYHIFSYKKEEEIKAMFDWSSLEKETIYSSTYSESVNNWLKEIEVSKENYPNYSNCKFWYNKQDDNSEIIILWDSTVDRLYVVESFL